MKAALYNLTTTTQFGGVESFVWEVARGLAARGVDTTIVGGRGAIHRALPGVRVVEFPFVGRARLRQIPGLARAYTLTKLAERLSFGAAAFAFMRRAHFDIIHIQKPYDLPPTVLLKSTGAGKIVFGCHGTDFFPGDRFFAPRADACVSCSAFNAAQIRAHYGLAPRVIWNGIDPELFRPQPPDLELRRTLAGSGALVLFVGRLVRWKGIQDLIAATARLAPEREVCLAIVGTGEYRAALERQAQALGLGGRVKFVGFVPPHELPRYYAASDVVALASYANETFSISLVEAMACERATVATDFGGIPEVVVHDETGLLARPRDAQDLAAKLGCALDDASRRARLGAAGRRRALELFTWDKVTERVLEVYHRLCPGAGL